MKRFLRLVAYGGLLFGALLAALWLEHRLEITLPVPTGHFAVGRTTYSWVNPALADELAPIPGAKREVAVWIWYPEAAISGPSAEYQPAAWRAALSQNSGVLMSDFLTRDSAKVFTHSSTDGSVSAEQTSYPVVIIRSGGGALTTDFTTLAEDLASHGYVVVGFDAAYRTVVFVTHEGQFVRRPPSANPENLDAAGQDRLIDMLLPMWTTDAQFVVDHLSLLNAGDPRFTSRLDLERLGIFGHSFGGATALQFCHDDSRCKAGIDIDGDPFGSVVKEGLTQPFMFLVSDHGNLSDPEARDVFGKIQSIYDRLPNGRQLLMIKGANHFSFSDQILLKSQFVIRLLQLFQGGLNGRRGLAITTAYVHTFFDVYLKNAPASSLESLRQAYPEVQSPR